MPDYYVALVKEYLELMGFLTRTEIKYKIRQKDVNDRLTTNWGDIDILGVKLEDDHINQLIIGEVKGESKSGTEIRDINIRKFENKFVKKKFRELCGNTEFEKYLFHWSNEKAKSTEVAAELDITLVSFEQIINYLLNVLVEHTGWFYLKDNPNLMLLQYLKDREFF